MYAANSVISIMKVRKLFQRYIFESNNKTLKDLIQRWPLKR
jgi:hypothetical protein